MTDAPSPAQAATAKPTTVPPKLDRLPPYRVLLHNDDVNDFDHVIGALVEIVSFPVMRAAEITFEADRSGLALVTVTHKERAELIVERLISKGLTATMEPEPA